LAIILPSAGFIIAAFFVVIRITILRKQKKIMQIANNAVKIDLDGFNLSPRETEVCKLLLTDLSLKNIASYFKISYSGANFHVQNIYRKLDVQSRTELLVKLGNDYGSVQE
jgi:DNA-binding CsgD family transcriptional regulator